MVWFGISTIVSYLEQILFIVKLATVVEGNYFNRLYFNSYYTEV